MFPTVKWETVAPYAGAWIEMIGWEQHEYARKSHPTRVRGLKYIASTLAEAFRPVAPYAGAWIEISGVM